MLTLGVIAKHGATSFRSLVDKASGYVDHIIVALDCGSDEGIAGYRSDIVEYFERPLALDFSAQRNAVCERLKTRWVLFLDTDETLTDWFWERIRTVLDDTDLILLPRKNFTSGVGDFINWPDWQPKLHRSHVRWEKPVHEWPVGYSTQKFLPEEERYAILHSKTVEQQSIANILYDRILSKANPG